MAPSSQHTSDSAPPRRAGTFHGGFSLVELLVAMAIVTFLIVMLSQIISGAQGLWRTSESRTDAFREARAAIDLMARDLSVALTNDRAPTLALSNVFTQSDDPTAGPTHNRQVYALIPMRNAGDPAPAAAPPAPTPTPARSDICAIGFYCSWDANRNAYVLRKHVIQSNPTFTTLQAAFGAPTPTPPASPSPAPTGPPIAPTAIYQPSVPATPPAEDEDVAAYVWDLTIVPYELVGGVPTPNNTYPVAYRATLPQFVEISFRAMSPQAARQLQGQNIGPETWFDQNSAIYRNQILPYSQVFRARVRLQNTQRP
jgi:prepilin-type N-terminal cleavage/methylation domain-containing protein